MDLVLANKDAKPSEELDPTGRCRGFGDLLGADAVKLHGSFDQKGWHRSREMINLLPPFFVTRLWRWPHYSPWSLLIIKKVYLHAFYLFGSVKMLTLFRLEKPNNCLSIVEVVCWGCCGTNGALLIFTTSPSLFYTIAPPIKEESTYGQGHRIRSKGAFS